VDTRLGAPPEVLKAMSLAFDEAASAQPTQATPYAIAVAATNKVIHLIMEYIKDTRQLKS
jgi:hypothetical protein